jgi:hypothetical protein
MWQFYRILFGVMQISWEKIVCAKNVFKKITKWQKDATNNML